MLHKYSKFILILPNTFQTTWSIVAFLFLHIFKLPSPKNFVFIIYKILICSILKYTESYFRTASCISVKNKTELKIYL